MNKIDEHNNSKIINGTFHKLQREQQLATYVGEDEVISASELKKRLDLEPKASWSCRTKIPTIDKWIGPMGPGQMVITSGPTGFGKTTFDKSISQALTEQDIPSMWLTYEIGSADLINSFPEMYRDYFYLPAKITSKDLSWIEDRTLEAILKYKVKAIFIDHLHRIVDLVKIQNTSLSIGATVQNLKLMAVRYGVIIFLIAHMVKTKADIEPGLGDIRDSSLIEQEADIVFYTWRAKTEYHNFIKIAKNRPRGFIDKKVEVILRDGRYWEVEK